MNDVKPLEITMIAERLERQKFTGSQHDADKSTWLKERKRGIGSSDMPVVAGLSSYKGPLRLWHEKTGRMLPEDLSSEMEIRLGHKFEPVIADLYEEKTGRTLRRVNRIQQHREHDWMLASPDRITYGDRRNVELKTVTFFDPTEWGQDGGDRVPANYTVQVQHQMAVLGEQYQYSDIAALAGRDFRVITVARDPVIIAFIIEEGERFWWHVTNDVMPDPKSLEDVKLRWPTSLAKPIDATPEILAACEKLAALKASQKECKAQIEELEFEIKAYMGEYDTLRTGTRTLATWKTSEPSFRIKEKELKAGDPETFALWAEERTTRPLLLKGQK